MATSRIIVLLNLKPGKDKAAYEQWARDTDLKTVNDLGSVDKFAVFETTGLMGSDARPPYDYIEILDINDMEAFGTDVSTDTMTRVAAEFQGWADPIFITTRNVAG